MSVGVAIIGCGGVARKRAGALAGARLVACVDVARDRAEALAATTPGARAYAEWGDALDRRDVEIVIVCTPHASLAPAAQRAAEAGKHVLVEKPAARSAAELEGLERAAEGTGVRIRVGFNHRYHGAMRAARALVDEGRLGDLLYVRGRYGHGGRPGYEKEWRADPALSGGGELVDQGVHLIDLSRWFLGEFPHVAGSAHTYFWNMPVEDNGFLLLRTERDRTAFLHASWTEWKNLFSFEITGTTGKLEIDGLGGSYGPERLTFHRMRPEMGPPETTVREFPPPDGSWEAEFAEFLEDIRLGRAPSPGLADARAALTIVERLYRDSKP